MTYRAALLCLVVSACTQFPELDALESDAVRAAGFPRLLPLESLRADARARATDDVSAGVGARAEALRARAARLRGPVLDRPTRARLNRARTTPR